MQELWSASDHHHSLDPYRYRDHLLHHRLHDLPCELILQLPHLARHDLRQVALRLALHEVQLH